MSRKFKSHNNPTRITGTSHEKIFHNQARALIINCSRYFTKKQERQHKKEHQTLIAAKCEVSLETRAWKTKCVFMSRHQVRKKSE